MACYLEVLKEIEIYLYARTPLIILKSGERDRVERLLGEVSRNIKHDIYGYSSIRQLYKMNSLSTICSTEEPLQYISHAFKKKRGEIYSLIDFGYLENDNLYSRDILNLIYTARENEGTLILVSDDLIWNRISNLGLICNLNYPSQKERIEQIEAFVEKYKKLYKSCWTKEEIILASTVLKGFSEIQIENILSANLIKKNGFYKEDILLLANQKQLIYGNISNLKQIIIDKNIELYGLENFKKRMDEKKKVFFADEKLLEKYNITYPKGVLLTGIPGCGKSLSAKYIAAKWNLQLFKFDIDTIFNKYVGESERKMQEALAYADRMAPCILWIDEIEKALSISSDGNDTGKRIMGQFLFWLQESKSRVFLIATANDISKLPPELFRKGRFSEIFFIDLPNEVERKESLKYYIQKSLHMDLNENEMTQLLDITNGFSYADLESSIKEIAQSFIINEEFNLDFNLIKNKLLEVIPYERTNPDTVKKSRQWGKERATLASLERN